MTDVDDDARILWDYMQMHQTLSKSDILLVCGSMDMRVAEYAAELYKQGLSQTVITTGGYGRFTEGVFEKTEADLFAEVMIKVGVPTDHILREAKSTNTGENIQFSYELIRRQGLKHESIIIVQKPYMERRVYATFKKQWPDPNTKFYVTSPPISFDDYFTTDLPKDHVINATVGDMQRIREYPKLGFQIPQEIPDEVWHAYERLVAAGYDEYLI